MTMRIIFFSEFYVRIETFEKIGLYKKSYVYCGTHKLVLWVFNNSTHLKSLIFQRSRIITFVIFL